MSRIWSMMDVGRRSLANSQTALQTTAHNVANKSTEGYSRQRVDVVTNLPVGEGKMRIGMGARASDVTRTNNEFLEKQIEREGNQFGFLSSRSGMLGRVEQVYNEQVNKGLNHSLGGFFNALRELSNNPESLATRTAVKESADLLTKDFARVDTQLKEIQMDADFQIATKVEEVNQLTKEIAQLNEKITGVEIGGATANDERDRRDLLVKKLSEKVNVRYAESKDGQLTITAGNTAVLVSGFSQRDLTVQSTPEKDGKREGNFEVFYKSTEHSTPVNVTKQLNGGELGGLLQVRDDVVNKFIGGMDDLAYTVGWEVNRAHVQGYDRQGRTGNMFFELPMEPDGAASNFKVSEVVANDVGRIAAAAQANAPGDNTIANILSGLQFKQVLDDNTATVDDFYNSLVGKIGIEAQRANSAQEAQGDIVGQLKNLRESISGVSIDEEMTKMIEYQKGFDASARLVRTADEMMDTVLSLKRL
ncbi:MAG TPA: flagellar hook-associated protein FlgK [Bdellovibrionales bacterium]|nr:flagellar hook-associated protein FlgK [Bdellovibrionales bacterium]